MHEGPTENRLGELGSLYKYYIIIIIIYIITFVGEDEKESQHGPKLNLLHSITQRNKHHHRLPSNPLRGIK